MKMNVKLKRVVIISTVIMFVISSLIYINQHIELAARYKEAVAYADGGDFVSAREVMSNIGEYKNSDELIEAYTNEIDYQNSIKYMEEGDYDTAQALLQRLNAATRGYKDSVEMQNKVEYVRAKSLASAGKLNEAYEGFKSMPISYLDVANRIEELGNALKFTDKWYCKEHQIDLVLSAKVTDDNIVYIDAEMRDRNGFLLGDETNKLNGYDLLLMGDRFTWNILGNDIKFVVVMEDNRLKIAKHPVATNDYIVTFARKLESYNKVDGDIDAAVKRKVDSGI